MIVEHAVGGGGRPCPLSLPPHTEKGFVRPPDPGRIFRSCPSTGGRFRFGSNNVCGFLRVISDRSTRLKRQLEHPLGLEARQIEHRVQGFVQMLAGGAGFHSRWILIGLGRGTRRGFPKGLMIEGQGGRSGCRGSCWREEKGTLDLARLAASPPPWPAPTRLRGSLDR